MARMREREWDRKEERGSTEKREHINEKGVGENKNEKRKERRGGRRLQERNEM